MSFKISLVARSTVKSQIVKNAKNSCIYKFTAYWKKMFCKNNKIAGIKSQRRLSVFCSVKIIVHTCTMTENVTSQLARAGFELTTSRTIRSEHTTTLSRPVNAITFGVLLLSFLALTGFRYICMKGRHLSIPPELHR